jgi:2,3-bisphosphoglycerate-independent phosphoglycerate mutase
MGNSEVGHLNLGAGFVVYQWLTRLDKAIADGEFARNPALLAAVDRAKATGGTLHLLGLVSDGGVHSHLRHLAALLRLARDHGLGRVAVHAFTDGRDTAPTAGIGYVESLERAMAELGVGRIASVAGRYYAMDRDKRWERIARAYDAIVHGVGERAASATEAIRRAYAAGTTDEFVPPTVVVPDGQAPTTIRPGDAAVCFNFRADRMRQLTEALVRPDFAGFGRGAPVPNLSVTTISRYEADLPVVVAFASQDVEHPVARAVSEAGLAQFHAAETEKYAHVTFFFNGGREAPFPGEERALIPSPKVATYDLQPEMSAPALTDAVVAAIAAGRFPFLIVNYANGDMVGHTGVLAAAIRAIETVDACLDRVVAATLAADGVALVTADHGNAEEMIDRATGRPMTAHTTNPVPVLLVAPEGHPRRHATLRQDGRLCAVAPTLLGLLGVPAPGAMTEASLSDFGPL